MLLQVETTQLSHVADDIEELIQDYMNHYRALYSMVEESKTSWQGKDQDAFLQKINGFEDDFVKMSNLILEYVAFLRTASKAYSSTQDSIMDCVSRLIG